MKNRLDILILKKNLVSSREKAKNLILQGKVFVSGKKILKPSAVFEQDSKIEVDKSNLKYVSRGGLKLEKAINEFKIKLKGFNCLDIGASTGGFTDVMLKNDCNIVYAVDVGFCQLEESLKNNRKVVNLEKTNIRTIDKSLIKHTIDFFSVDVSFISLLLVLPSISELIKENSEGVCLIKPQFEAGRKNVGKHGIVKNEKIHIKVINKIFNFCLENSFSILNLSYSPIKGSKGNIEYLLHLKKSKNPSLNLNIDVNNIVKISHLNLKNKEV